jgi:hypothetical protein
MMSFTFVITRHIHVVYLFARFSSDYGVLMMCMHVANSTDDTHEKYVVCYILLYSSYHGMLLRECQYMKN